MTQFSQPPASPQELTTLYDDFTQLQSLCIFSAMLPLRQTLQVICEVMD